jgi:hypothetical protein
VAHSVAILDGNPHATALHADLRQPEETLAAAEATGLLDPSRPIGLLMMAVLHFVTDEDRPVDVVRTFRDRLPAGSYLALSHATHELHPAELTSAHRNFYRRTPTPMTMRDRSQVETFFEGLQLVDPGVVLLEQWHPDGSAVEDPERFPAWVGVGHKA